MDIAAALNRAYRRPAGFARVVRISHDGLGMGALHSAVQALGGALEIDSEPGPGTCVRLRFPEASVRSRWQRN